MDEDIKILKALANGVNYFTGEKCTNDSILNDANIVRTLFNVCDRLSTTLTISKKPKLEDFKFSTTLLEEFNYSDEITTTEMIRRISLLYPNMKKLKFDQIFNLLQEKNLAAKVENGDGGSKKIATEYAKQFGIYNKQKTSLYGVDYQVMVFNKDGQKYVLSLLNNL